jgi:hypothetical protein
MVFVRIHRESALLTRALLGDVKSMTGTER